jgi:gamma-glutamylcysteine synthetase
MIKELTFYKDSIYYIIDNDEYLEYACSIIISQLSFTNTASADAMSNDVNIYPDAFNGSWKTKLKRLFGIKNNG